jgi:replication-associated recombination protein RarA
MANYQTKHGFNDDEVVSALQKQIRRGVEDEALYWALELCENGAHKSGFSRLRNRLIIISYEDIGIGDPETVLQVSIAIRDMEKLWKKDNAGWKIILAYIILKMCRSKKSRITDHFQTVMDYVWNEKKPEEMDIQIPDYAVDMHTSQGNLRGRTKGSLKGIEHFIKEGGKLENINTEIEDVYKKQAHHILKKNKK